MFAIPPVWILIHRINAKEYQYGYSLTFLQEKCIRFASVDSPLSSFLIIIIYPHENNYRANVLTVSNRLMLAIEFDRILNYYYITFITNNESCAIIELRNINDEVLFKWPIVI